MIDDQMVIYDQEISLPEKWDYADNVKSMKSTVKNMTRFTLQFIKDLYIAKEKLNGQGRKDGKTFETFCKDIGVSRAAAYRWIGRYNPKTEEIEAPPKKKVAPKVAKAPKGEPTDEPDITIDVDEPEPRDVTPKDGNKPYDLLSVSYKPDLIALTRSMRAMYNKFASMRAATTPQPLKNMVGNLKEMEMRLMTWIDPSLMEDCPICKGSGTDPVARTKCGNCLDGKVGKSKHSEY